MTAINPPRGGRCPSHGTPSGQSMPRPTSPVRCSPIETWGNALLYSSPLFASHCRILFRPRTFFYRCPFATCCIIDNHVFLPRQKSKTSQYARVARRDPRDPFPYKKRSTRTVSTYRSWEQELYLVGLFPPFLVGLPEQDGPRRKHACVGGTIMYNSGREYNTPFGL